MIIFMSFHEALNVRQKALDIFQLLKPTLKPVKPKNNIRAINTGYTLLIASK